MKHSSDGKSQVTGGRRQRRQSLVATLTEDLRRHILATGMAVGDKLPSEANLSGNFGVSRTVVREALAALRYDGLVEPRQGAGVFVCSTVDRRPGRPLWGSGERMSSTIEVLELRAAVEIEAAALAAKRRSPAQGEAIYERLRVISALHDDGKSTSAADFEFHLAIAEATNNPRFREFLMLMGPTAIPRAAIDHTAGMSITTDRYIDHIQDEHKAIAEAVMAQDPDAAAAAVRVHLMGSLERYRQFFNATNDADAGQ